MLGTLALAAQLAVATPEISVDLFLLAGNSRLVEGFEWIEKPSENEGAERLLRPYVESYTAQKRPFIILDGGDMSLFGSSERKSSLIFRRYSDYDSMTQTIQSPGKAPKTEVVARTESTETDCMTLYTYGPERKGYLSLSYLWFRRANDSKDYLALQDMNSLETVKKSKIEQERETAERSIILSRYSLQTTKQKLGPDFKGIGLCSFGRADSSSPNLASFPPPGVVVHYQLSRTNGQWALRQLEQIR